LNGGESGGLNGGEGGSDGGELGWSPEAPGARGGEGGGETQFIITLRQFSLVHSIEHSVACKNTVFGGGLLVPAMALMLSMLK
jgi:hypothetical protein